MRRNRSNYGLGILHSSLYVNEKVLFFIHCFLSPTNLSFSVIKLPLPAAAEEFFVKVSGDISQLLLLLPQLEFLASVLVRGISLPVTGSCFSKSGANSDPETVPGLPLSFLRSISSSNSSMLRRWEIFSRSPPISRSSSTFERW